MQFLYEDVTGFIEELISGGTLAPGGRLPSLRQITVQRRVSLSTALQAYRLLEDRGVIEARPQSGFYVTSRPAGLPVPQPSRPPLRALDVSVASLVLGLLEYAADPRLVPLGCAIPSAELLAASGLDRFLARAARVKGVESNIYTGPRGDLRLRQEIARRAAGWGQVVAADDIAVTCGCTEALMLALRATVPPGGVVAVESPTYFGVLHTLEVLGLKALELPTDATDGIDLAALEKALVSGRVDACLLSSSFNNPLGCSMPDATKVAVLDLLTRHDVPLIEDDIYGDLYFGKERLRPFAAFDRGGNVIYCASFSKTLAPGYRIGWIAPGRYMQKVLEQKFATTLCGPVLPQVAFADFLSSGGYDLHLRRMRRVFAGNVAQMVRGVEKAFPPGTRLSRPAGGFVLWVELPKGIRTRRLLDDALRHGVCFAPGDVFSASGRYAHCLRLSCGYDWDDRLAAGIATLGRLATEALASHRLGQVAQHA